MIRRTWEPLCEWLSRRETKHRELLTEIFAIQSDYGYRELLDKVKLKYQEYGIEFGDSKAREFISHNQNLGIVKHNGKQGVKARYFLADKINISANED